MSAIGTGQYIWLRMWNGDPDEPGAVVIQDGVLHPGQSIFLKFTDGAQLVTHVALDRITKDDAEQLAAEKGVQKQL